MVRKISLSKPESNRATSNEPYDLFFPDDFSRTQRVAMFSREMGRGRAQSPRWLPPTPFRESEPHMCGTSQHCQNSDQLYRKGYWLLQLGEGWLRQLDEHSTVASDLFQRFASGLQTTLHP
jgi:hypothetical protein